MNYISKEGAALSAERIAQLQRRYNRMEGARKAQITKGNKLYIPGKADRLNVEGYVRAFESLNCLKPGNYAGTLSAMKAHPHHVERDLPTEYDTKECTFEQFVSVIPGMAETIAYANARREIQI